MRDDVELASSTNELEIAENAINIVRYAPWLVPVDSLYKKSIYAIRSAVNPEFTNVPV